MLLDNARLGIQRFSPWPGTRPVRFPLKPSARLLGTSSPAVGTLPGSLYFCMSSSCTGSCDRILLPVLCSLSSQSTRSASANQCRAMSLNAPLTLRSVLCAARSLGRKSATAIIFSTQVHPNGRSICLDNAMWRDLFPQGSELRHKVRHPM